MSTVSELMSQQVAQIISDVQTWSIFYNVREQGCTGDGTTDDSSALSKLFNTTISGNAVVIFPRGSGGYRIATNIIIPSNVTLYFVGEATLKPDVGVTVTINGGIIAGVYPIFSGLGTISGKPIVEKFFPQWWGAIGDGILDNTAAITSMKNTLAINGGTVFFPKGNYLVTDSTLLVAPNGTMYVGDAALSNFKVGSTLTSIPAFTTIPAYATFRVLISDGSGLIGVSSVTSNQLGYLSTTTSDVQTQLNSKATNTFSSIAVPSQATVVADSAADMLNLIGAGVINITTDPLTDTITISTAGVGAGTVTNVTSPNSDISVATGTSTPALTLNSSLTPTPNSIVKRDGSGNVNEIGILSNLTTATKTDLVSAINETNVLRVTAKSANATLTISERGIIAVTTAASTITITLPSATTAQLVYIIKKVDSGAGTVSIATTSSQTIDGTLTKTLTSQYESIMIVSDGTNWIVEHSKFNGGTVGSHIEFVDSTVSSAQSSMVISRDANFTGGTSGFVNSGLYVYDNVRDGVTSYEWGITSQLNNYASAGQHVGIATYAHQYGLSPTWGMNIVAWRHSSAPSNSAGLIGIELGLVADGNDTNQVRIGLDLGASPDTGVAPTFYCGIRIGAGNGDANAGTFANGIILNSKMTSGITLASTGTYGIQFKGSNTIEMDFSQRAAAGTAIRLKSADAFAFDSNGLMTMAWNTANGHIEFKYNGTIVGYIDSAAASHAL